MTELEKEKRKEDFEWWITCLLDKIEDLKDELPEEVSIKLDFSLKSLNVIEGFILENYTKDFLKSNEGKETLDRLASYIGYTYKKLLPNCKWHIELDEPSDMYYSLPSLTSENEAPISPYVQPITVIIKKRGDFLSKILAKRLESKA